MEPFESYPEWLKNNPRCLGGGSSRTGYGLVLQRITKQTECAYCELSMVNTYHHWLHMTVDHVIPGYMAKHEGWREWVDNANNMVICCSACNGFLNGFRLAADTRPPSTFEEFVARRDSLFSEKKARALKRHEHERCIFEKRPWEKDLDCATLRRRP